MTAWPIFSTLLLVSCQLLYQRFGYRIYLNFQVENGKKGFFSGGSFTRNSFLSPNTCTSPAVVGQTYRYGETNTCICQPIFIVTTPQPCIRSFFFCRRHPVVLFLTVSKIQFLPSDTTNNIIITMNMDDYFRSLARLQALYT